MRKNDGFLMQVRNAKTRVARRRLMRGAGAPEISTMAEIAKNVLAGKIKLSPKQKRALCKYKRHLRRLASRKYNYKVKKRSLMRGGMPIVPLLISTIGPLLASLIKRK